MKKILNTLYITSEDSYLSLDGENLVVLKDSETLGRIPLHNFESIITFGYTGASPALMGKCAENNISLCFLTPNGKYLARIVGKSNGNVLLRKVQYRYSDSTEKSLLISKNIIAAKLYNSRKVLERTLRDHELRIDKEKFVKTSRFIKNTIENVKHVGDLETLRGFEGEGANRYFSIFDDMILSQKEEFFYKGRTRRPPLDNTNALLSFAYTLLTNDMASALEAVGLDSYVGFLHRDRPGRVSLALDMIEELRHVMADRFILTLINRKEITGKGFIKQPSGGVIMKDETRKKFLTSWQEKKQEEITHPFIKEKIKWGLIPHVQAMLLARYIRGDLDAYPSFLMQ